MRRLDSGGDTNFICVPSSGEAGMVAAQRRRDGLLTNVFVADGTAVLT
jgi:hypothetical protein